MNHGFITELVNSVERLCTTTSLEPERAISYLSEIHRLTASDQELLLVLVRALRRTRVRKAS